MDKTTEQVNMDALTRARRNYGAQAVATMLRSGEVHRRFGRYTTKGRGLIDPEPMSPEAALEMALEDVFGNPQHAASRHFVHLCTPVNIRRMKQYSQGGGQAKKSMTLGSEADVRAAMRKTKDRGLLAEMLAAEYQGRNVDARPRPKVLKALTSRLSAIAEMEEGKAVRTPASEEDLAAALDAK